ncbi:MAG: ankyrin repeat domain-containing protein [Candidatus Babeliales bacterium]|jgi:ankyrin repeat protein
MKKIVCGVLTTSILMMCNMNVNAAQVESSDEPNEQAQLFRAIDRGRLKDVKRLLETTKEKTELLGKYGKNLFPLNSAILKGNFKIVQYLVDQGAELQTSALDDAIGFHRSKIAAYLIDQIVKQKKYDLLINYVSGHTPLITAVLTRNLEIVKKLFKAIPQGQRAEALAAKDQSSVDKPTALDYARYYEQTKITEYLEECQKACSDEKQ